MNLESSSSSEIFQGDRGEDFKNFISNILELRGKLNSKTIELLLDDEGIEIFSSAFTHSSASLSKNYEFLEFVGDGIVNKTVITYLSSRFPLLKNKEGVKVLTRLKINLISKKTLASLAEKQGLWKYVSANYEVRKNKMNNTLEDVFEAFMGAIEEVADFKIKKCVGYSICYNIISSLLDEEALSTKHEDLYDSKTRLKELFDFMKNTTLTYEVAHSPPQFKERDREKDNSGINMFVIKATAFISQISSKKLILGNGSAPLKINAEKQAAEKALLFLKNRGIERPSSPT